MSVSERLNSVQMCARFANDEMAVVQSMQGMVRQKNMIPLRTAHGPAVQGGPRQYAMAVRSQGMPKGAVPAPLGWHGGSVERKCADDQRKRRVPLFAQLYFKINSGLRTRTAFRGCRSGMGKSELLFTF
uniref:Uncharacterized protein n=1 Tax=Trichuris muris TaxID=70415 RepID=A0A5S6QCY2_TRIMR